MKGSTQSERRTAIALTVAAVVGLAGAYGAGVWLRQTKSVALPDPGFLEPLDAQGVSGAVDGFVCALESPVDCHHQIIFYGVRRYGEATRGVWAGRYGFERWPLYLVFGVSDEGYAGYLVRPPEVPSGAVKLDAAGSQGLTVYRYDNAVNRAIERGNGTFDYRFPIDDHHYSMVVYSDDDARDMVGGERDWLNIVVHETFHAHQMDGWRQMADRVQDRAGYPLTSEVLALSLLELSVVQAAAQVDEPSALKQMLAMYVAARAEKLRLGMALAGSMDNTQELSEGTARYLELAVWDALEPGARRRVHAKAIANLLQSDPGFEGFLRSLFAWEIWYEVGGVVLWSLERLGVDFVAAIESGQPPYVIARDHLALDSAALTKAFHEAQRRFDWPSLQRRAEYLASLSKQP